MTCAVVTGATGFIGLHLAEALSNRGDCTRALVRSTSRVDELQAIGIDSRAVCYDDVADLKAAVAGADVVFHVAGLIRALRPQEFYAANERATANLVEACAAQAKPPRLILISSVAAAGPTQRGQIRLEADPPQPASHYGKSKLAGERAAVKFADRMEITIVRPGIVFGPRDTGFFKVLHFIRHCRCHLSPGLTPPPLSYIHIDDLLRLVFTAAEHGRRVPVTKNGEPNTGRYFAVAPEYPTYADLGRMLRPMLARPRAPVIPIASPIAYCVAAVSEVVCHVRGKPEELCFDKLRDALAPSFACSGELAKQELGFVPAKPLVERLQETANWYLQNKWL